MSKPNLSRMINAMQGARQASTALNTPHNNDARSAAAAGRAAMPAGAVTKWLAQ
jgi:hypothetical protein